ncbi:HmuY family protein [Flavobacteriaceae bacterium F08102]|nr:HmuY family protein [Flavobacteriaceae bacterium F08102]
MKSFKFLYLFAFIFLASCSSDDDAPKLTIEANLVSNLHAPQEGGRGTPVSGAFTKFSFATGSITTDDINWDIAFRGTTIIVNGGESLGTIDEPARTGNASIYIASGSMATVKTVDESQLIQDSKTSYAIKPGSDNGWYNYAGDPTHVISPIPGKILVIKTTAGTYAKVEILSYYKDAPANPDAFTDPDSYYTFNYVYQPNVGVKTFE